MEANELRIGNLVMYDNRIFPIYSISKECPHLDTIEFGAGLIEFSDIKPIPLTEDWLLKFGFEKLNRDVTGYEKDNLIVEWLFESWTGRLYYDCDTSIRIIVIEYIHQLQNLYFTLTGDEL